MQSYPVKFTRGSKEYRCLVSTVDPETVLYHLAISAEDMPKIQNISALGDCSQGKLCFGDVEMETDADITDAILKYAKLKSDITFLRVLAIIRKIRPDYVYFTVSGEPYLQVNSTYDAYMQNMLFVQRRKEIWYRNRRFSPGQMVDFGINEAWMSIITHEGRVKINPVYPGSFSGEDVIICARNIQEILIYDVHLSKDDKGSLWRVAVEAPRDLLDFLNTLTISINAMMEVPAGMKKSAAKRISAK